MKEIIDLTTNNMTVKCGNSIEKGVSNKILETILDEHLPPQNPSLKHTNPAAYKGAVKAMEYVIPKKTIENKISRDELKEVIGENCKGHLGNAFAILDAVDKYTQEVEKEKYFQRNIPDNSDAFRDWLKRKEIPFTPNGSFTSVNSEEDIYSIGYEYALYKQKSKL